jgi:thioredoxin
MIANMKRLIFPIMGVLLIAVYGCGGKTTARNSDSPEVYTARDVEMSDDYKGAIHLTKEDFIHKVMDYEQNPTGWVFKGDKPCLIDFYADWCAPCRISSPILEELANEYYGQIYVYKVDTEKEGELAAVFGIESIPAFLFCPSDGKPVMTAGIARTPEETKQMFREQIEKYLLKNKS